MLIVLYQLFYSRVFYNVYRLIDIHNRNSPKNFVCGLKAFIPFTFTFSFFFFVCFSMQLLVEPIWCLKYDQKINIYEIEHNPISKISSMGCGKLQQGSKVGKHFLQTTLNQVVAEKVITWIAGSSNPGRDHRDVILQVCTGSSNSTSKLNWISNIFEYHLHTS